MSTWKHKLELSDLFHNEQFSFEQRRDAIVERIKAQPWYAPAERGDDDELWWIIDELADTDNADYFDKVWDAFYDWADSVRVWVNTR